VTRRSWWRRNLWGLLLLPVLIIALLGLNLRDGYEYYQRSQALEPQSAASTDGWVDFSGARLRLADFAPADLDSGGKPIVVPSGIKVWRAVIEFRATDPTALRGCQILLEDDQERLYGVRPAELNKARIPFPGCTPDTSGAAGTAAGASDTYLTEAFFVAPNGARPVALRVTIATKLPRYVRLTVTG
jgi:hypothetical protein